MDYVNIKKKRLWWFRRILRLRWYTLDLSKKPAFGARGIAIAEDPGTPRYLIKYRND